MDVLPGRACISQIRRFVNQPPGPFFELIDDEAARARRYFVVVAEDCDCVAGEYGALRLDRCC
jgi:hypothetical protein